MSKVVADDAYLDNSLSFDAFGLDPRIIAALKSIGFRHPTLVQGKAIPLALSDNKDIIAKASTGSGKTAAYLIPIIQQILQKNASERQVNAIIFVPTKELASQVNDICKQLLQHSGNAVTYLNLANKNDEKVLRPLISSKPNIVISTPSRVVSMLKTGLFEVSELQETLQFVAIDEVDLMLTYGNKEDLDEFVRLIGYSKLLIQSFLMSATLNEEITELKQSFCSDPVVLKLNDEELIKEKDKLVQYYIKTSEFDKFLMIFIILKLNLIKGKILLFVNNIERGYRLKLFLQQFGIKSCVLNGELPVNSRLHIIEQYNKNYINLLIATDDSGSLDHEEQEPKKKKSKSDGEFGVSRGVDFKNVACVLNFDLPTTSRNYVHRIGRTARANKSGMALSFVVPGKLWGTHKQSCLQTAKKDEKILTRIVAKQEKVGLEVQPYKFDQSQLENFRYRVEDAFRAVTGTAIREARIAELKQEILTSDKLKRHFEENPQDLYSLRHDNVRHLVREQAHLKSIPNYLLPENMRTDTKSTGFVPFNKVTKSKRSQRRKGKGKKKSNPLKTFRA